MAIFSDESKRRLSTCDSRLQILFNKVIENQDCAILCGHRGKEEQDKAVKEGNSGLLFPFSKHNKLPSKAVDVLPYPVKWDDIRGHYLFAGYVMATADILGIKVKWGGMWKSLIDRPHWELVDE